MRDEEVSQWLCTDAVPDYAPMILPEACDFKVISPTTSEKYTAGYVNPGTDQ